MSDILGREVKYNETLKKEQIARENVGKVSDPSMETRHRCHACVIACKGQPAGRSKDKYNVSNKTSFRCSRCTMPICGKHSINMMVCLDEFCLQR